MLPILFKALILLSTVSSISCTSEEPKIKKVNIKKLQKDHSEKEKCYEGLGCVSITSRWYHKKWRPVNVLPEERHVINTHFVLWQMKQCKLSHNQLPQSPEALGALHLDTVKEVKVIIHDFASNAYTEWIEKLVSAILQHSHPHTSVVAVDWSPGAGPPFVQAVANARLVSMEVTRFLRNLQAVSKMNSSQIHLIGHGVGAHIAGYVGKCTPHLGRITGLDPTGPYFIGMPSFARLHFTDASVVEAVHTDGSKGGQGYHLPLGHVDYFPNSGKKQPGCKKNKMSGHITGIRRCDLDLGQIIPDCSHERAYKYYIEAISSKACIFVGYKCGSYKSFLLGRCIKCGENGDTCARISLYPSENKYLTTGPLSKFYLLTSSEPNFCLEVLKFTLGLAYSEKAQKTIKGTFNVSIFQNERTISLLLNEKAANRNLVHGRSYTYLVYHKTPPAIQMPIHSVAMGWHHDMDPLCHHCNLGAFIHNFTITKLMGDDHGPHTYFCANNSEGLKLIKNGHSVQFSPCTVLSKSGV